MTATRTEQVKLLRIIDGDTVEVQRRRGILSTGAKERIRLYGIDAPESAQKGGDDATKYLGKIIGGRTRIWLEAVATDQYGRTVGVISRKRGDRLRSYNYDMVKGGHAHCYMVDPADREAYTQAENYAKEKRRGLWRARKVQVFLLTVAGLALAVAIYLFSSGRTPSSTPTSELRLARIDWDTATYRRQERGDETRYASLAMLDDRLYHLVWTHRDPYTRIISLRKANDREIARYEREQA